MASESKESNTDYSAAMHIRGEGFGIDLSGEGRESAVDATLVNIHADIIEWLRASDQYDTGTGPDPYPPTKTKIFTTEVSQIKAELKGSVVEDAGEVERMMLSHLGEEWEPSHPA